jgi:hypothetical protein
MTRSTSKSTPPQAPGGQATPPARKRSPTGATTQHLAGDDTEADTRLPHEHDESSDSQESAPREVIKRAHDDLQSGRQDTDRAAPMDELYGRTLRGPSSRR